ncbi:MAG: TlyA family RNA methyltransferase [Promethearchaeota archaeon]|nr:MAG: TlyA family RNA methyltransferase [Candidatus Lokiarchaeota archaeon]
MKERIDILLVERRLVESRVKAQWLIRNGFVIVDGIEIRKPGKRIDNKSEITLKAKFPYVGKGGLKLEAALKAFTINIEKKICIDIGASIGGFTDCLLKHGASKVYAVDTATDLLHPSLRCEKMKDSVVPLLGIDARKLKELDELVDFCSIDVTFSSLKNFFPNIKNMLKLNGDIVALIKPLFEIEAKEKDKFKIIRNPNDLKKILLDLIKWSVNHGVFPYGIIKSPILGKGGSIEFLMHLKIDEANSTFDPNKIVDEIL